MFDVKDLQEMCRCRICGVSLTYFNVARWKDDFRRNKLRLDSMGNPWCQACTDEHDDMECGASYTS